ncbi:MAG: Cro/CI family transcriptional regulator [Thermoplasmataceae archaeon]
MKTSIREIVNYFGSQSDLARALSIRPQSVQEWVSANRLPIRRALQIEWFTEGKIRLEDIIHLTGAHDAPSPSILSAPPPEEREKEPRPLAPRPPAKRRVNVELDGRRAGERRGRKMRRARGTSI